MIEYLGSLLISMKQLCLTFITLSNGNPNPESWPKHMAPIIKSISKQHTEKTPLHCSGTVHTWAEPDT